MPRRLRQTGGDAPPEEASNGGSAMRLRFWRTVRNQRVARQPLCFKPGVETFEERVVMDASLAAPQLAPALFAPTINQATSLLPLRITNVAVQNGQLIANGLIGNQAFTAPLTVTAAPQSTAATPILSLQLAPIHLNLLGLTVDTSNICLNVSAQAGPGNLLGNLLSNVANLLNDGSSLGGILGGLTSAQTTALTSGITGLLNGALGAATSSSATPSVTPGNVLHLSLGPVNLNLLGLQVRLDNCNNGPVTVDISAVPGPGNLLGNLISGLAGILDRNHVPPGLLRNQLSQISNAINGLLGQAATQVVPIRITGVSVQNGQLVASGLLGDQTFTAPVTLALPATTGVMAAAAATPVLNLMLGPIHLDLLGLTVDTSPICLSITPQPGAGNLLGNLLTDVANLLNGGLNLGQILGQLMDSQLTALTGGLTGLLNGALGAATSQAATPSAPAGNILHLALGPVDLTLLGLNVHLDNCNNGPVTVDVSAVPGAGNLLGNLLSGLSHLLDHNPLNAAAIDAVLADITNVINRAAV